MYDYNIVEGGSPLFLFKTSNQYTFQVQFGTYPSNIDGVELVYTVSVDCITTDKPKEDPEVGETICFIVNDFLTKNIDSLLMYVCDIADNRHHARQRKFYRWYKEYNEDDTRVLKKYEIIPNGSKAIYYTSIIWSNTIYDEGFIDSIYTDKMNKIDNK